jgi:hypothetical protein
MREPLDVAQEAFRAMNPADLQVQIDSLWDWYLAAIRGGSTPSLVEEIAGRLAVTVDPDMRREIYAVILGEARRLDRPDLYRRYTGEALLEFPDDIILYTGLSSVSLILDGDPDRALVENAQALSLARQARRYRRYCLGQLCRIAVSIGDRDLWKQGLEEIMSFVLAEGEVDIGRERDLIENLPEEFASDPIVELYTEFLEPPKLS